ncbi:MAG: dimethylsulfonioproprionate lyase family protein [Gammaproteobacteria bacterium]|jgi:hypothetical protein|nr:dimethylsulfonioproprionate lyase family protein [Gammaproteobacteria bacterium]
MSASNQFPALLGQLLGSATGLSTQGQRAAALISGKLTAMQTLHWQPEQARSNAINDLTIAALAPTDLPPELAKLVSMMLEFEPFLPWYQRSIDNHPALQAGHANAQIIGPQGLVVREDISVGVSLLAPDLIYPEHQHPPEEIYLVLSEGLWWQTGQLWQAPGMGGLVYNAHNVLHSMRSGQTPLVAIWCLHP